MLKTIMNTAWNIFRANKDSMSFSEALRMAWMAVRDSVVSVTSISTNHGVVLVNSDARLDKINELKKAGRRVYCTAGYLLPRYVAG